jgi:hypothetical protein
MAKIKSTNMIYKTFHRKLKKTLKTPLKTPLKTGGELRCSRRVIH